LQRTVHVRLKTKACPPCEVNRKALVARVLGHLQHIFKLDSGLRKKNLCCVLVSLTFKKKAPETDAFLINQLA